MKFPSWLRNPIGPRTTSRKRSLLSRNARGPRLMIEPLEERVMLANVFWNVDASGSWDDENNWSTGAVPGGADDVFLDRPAGNFTITRGAGNFTVNSIHASNDSLVVAGGTLTITATSELGDFSFASLVLNGSLTTSGNVNWSAGSISSPTDPSGDPINTFTNLGTMTLAGPGDRNVAAGLVNAGTILHAGLGNLYFGFGGILTNQAGAVYDLQADQSVLDGGTFINRGTLRKSGGTGTSSMAPHVFRNEGAVIDVQHGILSLSPANSGSATGGTFTVAKDAVLDLSSQGVQVYTGTYTGSGGGGVRLRLVGFVEYGFGLNVAGATFNFPDGMFQWMGGTLDGGAAGFNNIGSITFAGSDVKALRGVFNNAGTVVHAGTGDLSSGVFNNLAGGLYDLQGDLNIAALFNNTGTLRKSAGAGSSAFPRDASFNNLAGTIDVRSGTLTVNGGSYFDTTRDNLLLPTGTMLDLTGNSTVSGVFAASGDGIVRLSGASLKIGSAGTTFDFKPGAFQWTANGQSSTIFGADLTNLDSITLAGAGVEEISNTFVNAGTIRHAGLGNLYVGFGGTLTNQVGAVYDIQADQSVLDGGGTFINRGTLRKSGGTGTSSINAHEFRSEAGVIDVQDGILALNPFSNSASSTGGGTFTVATDAVLDLSSQGNPVYIGTYTGSGGGVVRLRLVGYSEYGFGLNVAGATFNFPTGMFQWMGGTLNGGAAGFNNTGSITLAGADLKSLRGVFNNVGTIVHAGTGDLSFATANTVLNNLPGSLYDLQGDSKFFGNGSGFTTFRNAGTVRKSGGTSAGNTTFGVDFVNAGGTIDVQTGTFVMKGYGNPALAHTGGTFRVAQNAMLDIVGHFAFDTQTFTGMYSGSGQGIIRLNSGTVAAGAGGAVFDFPPGMFQWIEGTIDGTLAPLTNRGTMTLTPNLQERQDSGIYPFVVGALTNAGTFNSVGAAHLFFQGSGVTGTLTNLPGGMFEFQGDGGSVRAGNAAAQYNFINQGTLRKSGPGTATINTTVFSNTGTLAVDAGAVRIQSPTVTQVSGDTLRAGTWQVAAGSSIDLTNVPAITTNNARVVLDGPGSSFAKLDTLANNSGSLSVLNGRNFTTAGSLTNSGSLILDAGSTLNVAGTYNQTAAGTLSVQVGGDPASGQFGQLASAGAATLDGTFNVALVGGFGPTVGQSFSVMSYPSHAGDFSTYTGLRLGRFPLFDANLTATHLILSALTSTADLAFDSFDAASFPTNVVSGQNVALTYRVKNLNDLPAMGDWIDSVYLSNDGILDAGDALLARVEHRGGVPELGSYSETVTAAMPPLATGAYRVILLVDSRGLTADANRGNNTGVSSRAIAVTVPLLVLGMPVAGSIAPGQDLYYRVLVPPGRDVTVSADFAALPGAELSMRYGALPDRTMFDDVVLAGQSRARLLLTNSTGGTYYLHLRGREDAAAAVGFTLEADVSGFEITRVSPLKGSNRGAPAILTLTGSQFTAQTQVHLQMVGGESRAAQSVAFISANKLVAKVDLANLPTGNYEVVAEDAGRTAVAFDTFTVTDKDAGATGAWISAVSFVKIGGPIYLKLGEYNSSDNPLPAAVFQLLATNVWDPEREETTGSLTIDTLPGYAPAHYFKYWNPYKVYGTSKRPGTSGFTLSVISPSQTPIDWDSQKATLRPATIPPDAWEAVWGNLRPQLGDTLSDFYQFLEITALKLQEAGAGLVEKIERLFGFELQRANNMPVVPVPATAVDIAFPAPGLPLVFGRVLGERLSSRSHQGRLGRGWTDSFDVSVAEDATTGAVTLTRGSATRFFGRRADGSYQTLPGDFSVMSKVNDTFQLREATGEVTAFRSDGLLDYLQDANGNRITAGYTGSQLTSLTSSSGPSLTLSYIGARLHQVTDPAGGVATYEYDASGEHLLRVTNTAGTTEYTYSAEATGPRAHALTSITFLNGTHLFFDYDSHGRLARQQGDGGANTLRFAYDTASFSVTDADDQVTTFFYDDSFRIRKVRDPLGRVSYIDYDASNNPVTRGTVGGGETSVEYDALGNPTSAQDPIGEAQAFAYEPTHSRLTDWKDALGRATQFKHDSNGNLLTTTYADGSTAQFSYDATGNVVRAVDRLGQASQFTYNSDGQIIHKELADGSQSSYTYTARGNLETVVDASGTTRLEYLDPQNPDLLSKITYPSGRFLEYTYLNGRRTRMVDQTGFAINYYYDAAGRLDVLRDGGGSLIVDYDYDAVGRLASETRGNFTVTLYAYDNAGQLVEITNRAPDATIQSQLVYAYDKLGRRTSVTTADGVTAYGYDGVGRLTTVTLPTGRVITYDYDAAGNRIASSDNGATTNYAVNELNEYIAFDSTNQTFDAAGNLLSSSSAAGSTSYRYDVEGRLVSQITPTGTWTYEYDALGNRVASTHDGVRTEYLVDPYGPGGVVGEYDGSGNLQAHYVHGSGLISRVDAAGPAAFYQFDAVGNTTQLTGASGAVLNSYSYLPFGESLGASETVANPFEYVGQFGVMRDGSGLDYMQNRWYDPSQGRFTQSDPVELAGGVNFYAYATNNPVSLVDPTGLAPGDEIITADMTPLVQAEILAQDAARALAVQAREALEFARQTQSAETIRAETEAWINWLNSNRAAVTGGTAATLRAGYYSVAAVQRAVMLTKLGRLGAYGVIAVGAAVIAFEAFYMGEMAAEAIFDLPNPDCIPIVPDVLQPGCVAPIVPGAKKQTIAVTRYVPSGDPNDMFGPAGFGAEGFVVPQATLPYRIDFQNVPAAGAPAQDVIVTHVLDADLDLDTFQLEDFGFGDLTVPVPPGRQFYSTRLDLRSTRGIFVDVTAGLDRVTRTVTWRLQAIDPETLDLPINPFFGFLPPDKVAPEGEGFVSFSVRAKPDFPSGTRIDAKATIVFDTNAPIDTNVWTNTLDIGPPTSTVNPLPAVTNSTTFTVSWSGSDDADGTPGSGIATFDVFVSDNGGPFVSWLHDTTQDSAVYPGESDHTYAFYTVATDNVGHVEPAPATADSSTIVRDLTAPTLVGMPQDMTAEATSAAGAAVSYTPPTAIDPVDPDPTVSCGPSSGSTFALGTTTVTCTAVNDAGSQSSAQFTITVRDTTTPAIDAHADIGPSEATTAAGRIITFTSPGTHDAVDGDGVATCLPVSGSTFPIGATIIQCSATDTHGNTSTRNFIVTVRDTTPPLLTLPNSLTVEAKGPAGAAVDFIATASDLVDGVVPILCVPVSGNSFAIGQTTVDCSATDTHGNTAHDNFTVTVRDATPPELTLPNDLTVEATGPAGAAVDYAASSNDLVDGAVEVHCDPAARSTFALGTISVNCSAADSRGNVASDSFHVTVRDTTAPTLIGLPLDRTVEATSATGAAVTFTPPTAVDTVDLAPTASCDHASGSAFALGTTTVTCIASDAAGNSRNGSFHVTVQDAIAPTIVGVEFIVKHVGKKLSAAGLRVSASELLQQGPAEQTGNYHLFTAGKDKRFGTPDDVTVHWQSAELDATQRTITLTTEQAMKFNQFYELIVSDALMDMASNRLHGAGSSVPGVGHVATLGAGTKLGFVDSSGDAVSLALKGGGFMQLSLAATGNADVLELEDTVAGRSVLSGSVNKPKRGTSDGITRIQSMTVAQGAKFRSTLRKPPFSIGPLAQSAIDDLLLASGGTLASVLISA